MLYIEAPDGISGDMTLGALIDLGVSVNDITRELDKVIPGEYSLIPREFERNGIHGINLDVIVNDLNTASTGVPCDLVGGEKDKPAGNPRLPAEAPSEALDAHEHRHYSDIKAMIEESGLADGAKARAIAIFDVIAEAEASVHNVPKEGVAFHEVGALDSIIDIVGTAIAIDILGVTEFYCSAPRDGSGTITCRHGLIPVTVPAVMKMAEGADIPIIIESDVDTEMITPTGFGIIKGLGAKFEPHLGFLPERAGYGFGKRDTGRLGAVRVTLGIKYEEE